MTTSPAPSFGDLCMTLRIVLTGTTVSEPIQDLLVVMGRETVLAKIDAWFAQEAHR